MAVSQIKAVELDFFSTSNCFSSCFLYAPVGDLFYERYNPFSNMDPLSEIKPTWSRPRVPRIDHFTVVFLVTWPLNGNEAEGDLVLIQTLLLLLYKSSCSYAN